jgi:hypothetical protein
MNIQFTAKQYYCQFLVKETLDSINKLLLQSGYESSVALGQHLDLPKLEASVDLAVTQGESATREACRDYYLAWHGVITSEHK